MKICVSLPVLIFLVAEGVSAAGEPAEMEAAATNAVLEQVDALEAGSRLIRIVEKLGGSPATAQLTRHQAVFLSTGGLKGRVKVSDYLLHRLGIEQIGICYDFEDRGVALTEVPREWGKPFRVEAGSDGRVRFFYARPFLEPSSAQVVVVYERATQRVKSLIFIFWLKV